MTDSVSRPPVVATTAAAPDAIPFRPETTESAGSIADVFLLLIVLLGGFVATLLFARKKGWLERWGVAVPRDTSPVNGLRIEQTLRLSPKSSLYRVRDGDRTLLILESSGTAQFIEKDLQTKEGP